ncbi:hypothetical protein [Methanobrevibacter ruminantium]|uniref:hypothetical protein n=2 Tax=Methanobrevibacter ruminantium TaxID=83816 RepID=UPI0026EF254B|nr:hypothetical protein [Methanobrevibacter ruminantium]
MENNPHNRRPIICHYHLNKSDMSKIGLAISLLKSLDFSNLNQNRIIPIITSILVFVEIGYGTRIVFKGLLGENKPLNIINSKN